MIFLNALPSFVSLLKYQKQNKMSKVLLLAMVMISYQALAQNNSEASSVYRKGLVFGMGIGAGTLRLKDKNHTEHFLSASLPNIKIGYMINNKLELLTILPGAIYKHDGKTRGFEGIIFGGQYWLHEQWWVSAGTGITVDAPAFYTVKDPKNAEFYVGFPASTLSTGYEIWHKGRCTIDLQYRLFLGKSNLKNDTVREGTAHMFIIGVNWY
jgi:hypothetical protein